MRPEALAALLLVAGAAGADGAVDFGGHTKARLVGWSFGEESLLREEAGRRALDAAGELRLDLALKRGAWSFQGDYQLLALYSEFRLDSLPDDASRLFDFTATLHDGGDAAAVHRLDRFWFGYTGDRAVVRFGRQALTWGNGLFFSPLDLVNPFDPTTIDTEYKTGDDMLYAQYLRHNGDDLQAAVVFRRDGATGDVARDASTVALKYHGFAGETEYDLLIADDQGGTVFGVGMARGLGGAVLRGDVAATDRSDGTVVEALVNLSYSWVWREHNVSAAAEYYYDGDGGHYAAGSLLVEMSPLWTLTPTLVSRADDPSALFQLVTQVSLADDLVFLGSLNLPLGPPGTEFGGPVSEVPDRYLSSDASLFAQLAWYF